MSDVLILIGFASIAGAIERGEGLLIPVILTLSAILISYRKHRRLDREETGTYSSSPTYPAALERIRR